MRTAIQAVKRYENPVQCAIGEKLRAVVADGSAEYLSVVCTLLEFHESVDLVGRAADSEEAIQLALKLRPDLILVDLDMPSAKLAISAINLCRGESGPRIIAMSSSDSIPAESSALILTVSAIVHKDNLREEFLTVLSALYDVPDALPVEWAARQENWSEEAC